LADGGLYWARQRGILQLSKPLRSGTRGDNILLVCRCLDAAT
jgi:hypothetical protein